jgi:hypothetical protein
MMISLARSNSVVSQRIKGGGSCRQRFIQALNLIDESSVPNGFKVEYEKLIGQQRRGSFAFMSHFLRRITP